MRIGDALEDEVEVRAQNNTCNANYHQTRGELAQSRECYHAGGECSQSRVISGCLQERVPREQMMHVDHFVGIAHMDVLVDEGEVVGRGQYLHQVQSESEADDEAEPLQRIDISCQSTQRNGNEDQQHAEPNRRYVGMAVFARRLAWSATSRTPSPAALQSTIEATQP